MDYHRHNNRHHHHREGRKRNICETFESDYDSSKLANGQLEAVGAVLSVVPVTSILATAGLVGVKLAALSRLLQVLGYDQAYLASGGSGTAAQPIGLQTNYAYMFPYVPGLNISVKGEHGSQYQNQAAHQKEAYSTTRKTFPAMGLPGDYESQNSPFRGAETLREIFRDSGIEFRYPTTLQQQQQQQQQLFNNPKGNGQPNSASSPPNNLINNNQPQQLATTPTYHHVNNNNNKNNNRPPPPAAPTNNNNNQHLSPSNQNEPVPFGQPRDPNQPAAPAQSPHGHPVNVIGHLDGHQPDNSRPPSTSSSLALGRPDQPQPSQPSSGPAAHQPEASSGPQPLPEQRNQRPQVNMNMPHPHNIQPHHARPTQLPVQAASTPSQLASPLELLSSPLATSPAPPAPVTLSAPPTATTHLHEGPLLTGSLTASPQDKPTSFHPIPQHDHFYRLQKAQAAALPSGQVLSLPLPLPDSSAPARPPKAFDDFARFTFDSPAERNRLTQPANNPQPTSMPAGFTGPPPSEVTTNIVPSTFSTDLPPPFHDDLENNEINLGSKRRRKRDLNGKTSAKAAREPSSRLSELMKPSRESSTASEAQLHHNGPNQHQGDRKNENFGMPALNIHPTFRRKRGLREILLGRAPGDE